MFFPRGVGGETLARPQMIAGGLRIKTYSPRCLGNRKSSVSAPNSFNVFFIAGFIIPVMAVSVTEQFRNI